MPRYGFKVGRRGCLLDIRVVKESQGKDDVK